MTDQYELDTRDGEAALGILDELADLYAKVHSSDAEPEGSIYRREAFVNRTRNQVQRGGFAIVHARTYRGELVGFGFGVPLGEGQWWTGDSTPPPDEILNAKKFAFIELIVAEEHRGQGLGRRLHDRLLPGRSEPYAILTTRAGNPARQMYARWGWQQVGTAQHTSESPVMDQLVLEL